MSKSKNRVGVVFSTNPDFQYQYDDPPPQETLPPNRQKLKVRIDRHGRGGKTVTLVTGFIGTDDDLQLLCKSLKNKCGVGGSAKDGEIIIQGDNQQKIISLLESLNYHTSKYQFLTHNS